MKLTSNINNLALRIRKEAAIKYHCNAMDISWRDCLRIAEQRIKDRLEQDKKKRQEKIDRVIGKSLLTACIIIVSFISLSFHIGFTQQTINQALLKYSFVGLFSSVSVCLLIAISTMFYSKNKCLY